MPSPASRRRAPAPAVRGLRLHAPEGPEPWTRLSNAIGWGAAAATLAVCLALAFGPHVIGDYFTETDFYGDYARGAELIRSGRLDPARYAVVGPGYELALAAVSTVVRDPFRAAQVLSAVSAALALLLWFHLLRTRLGALIAAAATLLIAANPTFLRYGHSATTDVFAVALQALALDLLLARSGRAAPALAGLAAAAAFLTRYTGLYLLPVGLIAIAADGAFRGRRLRAGLAFGAAFAAPVLAWTIFAAGSGGGPGAQLHHLIAYEAFARARGLTWDEYQRDLQPRFHGLLDVLRYDPRALVAQLLHNLVDHARLDARLLLGPAVAIAAVVGALLGLLDGTLRRVWPLLLAGTLAYAALVLPRYGERYSLMILPVYALLAGTAFGSRRFALALGPGGRTWLKPALIAIPLAFSLVAAVRLHAEFLGRLPREVLAAGRVLREAKRDGDGVIARKPHLAHVAGVRSVPFPFTTTLPELATYARARNARWLYVSYPEVESRQDYYPLLDTTGVIVGLTPRFVGRDVPAVLYEVGPGFDAGARWVDDPRLMNLRVARARLLLVPDDVEAMWLEAAMELQGGDGARAHRTLERAAAIDGRSHEALAALDRGDPAAAHAVLQRLLAAGVARGRRDAPGSSSP